MHTYISYILYNGYTFSYVIHPLYKVYNSPMTLLAWLAGLHTAYVFVLCMYYVFGLVCMYVCGPHPLSQSPKPTSIQQRPDTYVRYPLIA
ncbi:hypothetical protein F4779DRAFT_214613 [Xylariaceae sp. FL0662B]|nr:hypothetical protein F4779DRAFT_214613 [Xylariaceae sp. FL0662B]